MKHFLHDRSTVMCFLFPNICDLTFINKAFNFLPILT
jgi:hypothetical protein